MKTYDVLVKLDDGSGFLSQFTDKKEATEEATDGYRIGEVFSIGESPDWLHQGERFIRDADHNIDRSKPMVSGAAKVVHVAVRDNQTGKVTVIAESDDVTA